MAASSIRCAVVASGKTFADRCSTATMATGTAMSATSMKIQLLMLWRIQRNGCEKFT